MNTWKAAEILFFWVGVITLFVGLFQSIITAGPYYLGLNREIFNVLSTYIPYITAGAILLVVSRVCVYASKPPLPFCPHCGQHIRYIKEYDRWYCDYEKKYVTLTSG